MMTTVPQHMSSAPEILVPVRKQKGSDLDEVPSEGKQMKKQGIVYR